MNTEQIINMAKKLATTINKEFPEISDDQARKAAAKMLVNLHYEAVISYKLYEDQYDEMDAQIEARRLAKLHGDDLF